MRAEYSDHQKSHIGQAAIDFFRQQLHQGQVHTTIQSLRGLRLHRGLRFGFVSSTQPYPAFSSTASPFFPTVGCLVKRKNINANVRLRGVAAGISPLAAELEDVIKATLEEKLPRDCIIVLHDLDDAVQTYRKAYKRIGVICQKYADDVTLLVANQKIEACLLADEP